MTIFKKNIWFLYYIFIAIGLLTLTFIISTNHKNTLNKFKAEQINITKITANSMSSVFLQYEMILNILSAEITRDDNLISNKKIVDIYDNLLRINPAIVTLGLADINGNIKLTNSSNSKYTIENMLKNPKTSEGFQKAINSEKMIIGRTYYISQIKKFIIPLRKTVKDKKGNILGIITCGIDLEKGFDFFINNRKISSNFESFLFRDADYYFQFAPSRYYKDEKIYDYQIDKEKVEKAIKYTEKIYNTSIEEIKRKELIVTFKTNDGREMLASNKYLNRYQLWLTTQIPIKYIYSIILKESLIFIAIFFIVIIIIYFLFKNIVKAEIKKTQALQYQASHDYLTGLKNRQFLSNKIENNSSLNKYSLLFIDIDNFKSINDSYGHSYGDELLKQIARRVEKIVTKKELIIRYSGDEFLIITKSIDKKELEILAIKILENLKEIFKIKKYNFSVTASLGIASLPTDGKSFDELKRASDMAMYIAKKKKNSYCFFDDSLKEEYLNKLQIENNLTTSIKDNEIFLVYQPQVDTENRLYGVEALVRWINKDLGFIPPDKFIKVAEDIGFIKELGEYIIKTAIKETKNIQEITKQKFKLSINISLKQFLEEDFIETLNKYIKEYNYDTNLLTLELTENIFIENMEKVLRILNQLKTMGITISLDDFGTGYSSLNVLKLLPIDELKIDKSFIEDILVSQSSKNVVKSIISIGKEFNMNILCEGIEQLEQKNSLHNLHCDLFQGYYFAKPLKKEALIEYITK